MANVLYIPGLGGRRSIQTQRAWVSALNIIRSKNRKIVFFDPRWETDESYDKKYERLLHSYDGWKRPTKIWAISAGASLAVRLTVECPDVTDTQLVCGKVYGADSIGVHHQKRAPAFVESVQNSQALARSLDPAKVTCYVPLDNADGVIDTPDMSVPGSHIVDLPRYRHSRAIAYALARYLPRV